MKVYIVGNDSLIGSMFTSKGHEIVKEMEDADLVQFVGGHDVSPELYQEECQHHTHRSLARDLREVSEFFKALGLRLPMAGICRGGQFLNVCNGGSMIQHKEGHTKPHQIFYVDDTGSEADGWSPAPYVTSTHHQVIVPSNSGVILFVAEDPKDVEVVWYEDTNCLCFQPHPEMPNYPECPELYFALLNEYCFFS